MVCLLCRDHWCIGGQHEVDAWVWHQVGLEPWLQSLFIQSNHPIQTPNMSQKTQNKSTKIRGDKATKLYDKTLCALDQETQWCPHSMHHQIAMKQSLTAGRREKRWKNVCKLLTPSEKTPSFTCCWNEAQWGDDLGNQPVQVGVSWTLDVQVPATNIVEGLVVLKKWEQELGGGRGRSPPPQPEEEGEQQPQQGEQQHIQLATQSKGRVAYMMVTSVCSKREWTHLTLADSWWKPLTGNSFESYIWIRIYLHPHTIFLCSKTRSPRSSTVL